MNQLRNSKYIKRMGMSYFYGGTPQRIGLSLRRYKVQLKAFNKLTAKHDDLIAGLLAAKRRTECTL